MKLNEETKLIARFHTQPNNRGLNIYNPYFEAAGVNAVYLLFQNPAPGPLFRAMRDLGIAGAIPAAFEKNPELVSLVDTLSGAAAKIERVSFVKNTSGKLVGYYAAAKGLSDAVHSVVKVAGKRVVVMGAGTVVRGLLAQWELDGVRPKSIVLYNRTLAHAKAVQKEFSQVREVHELVKLPEATGDIFVNATDVGAPWNKEDYTFTDAFLQRFSAVADVTFVPLAPPLITSAQRLQIPYASGWKMFLYQGKFAMETILDISVDADLLAKFLVEDFAHNWV